jgi:hypothetical protein
MANTPPITRSNSANALAAVTHHEARLPEPATAGEPPPPPPTNPGFFRRHPIASSVSALVALGIIATTGGVLGTRKNHKSDGPKPDPIPGPRPQPSPTANTRIVNAEMINGFGGGGELRSDLVQADPASAKIGTQAYAAALSTVFQANSRLERYIVDNPDGKAQAVFHEDGTPLNGTRTGVDLPQDKMNKVITEHTELDRTWCDFPSSDAADCVSENVDQSVVAREALFTGMAGKEGKPALYEKSAAWGLSRATGFEAQDKKLTGCDTVKISDCADAGYKDIVVALAQDKLVVITTPPKEQFSIASPLKEGTSYAVVKYQREVKGSGEGDKARGEGFTLRSPFDGKLVDATAHELGSNSTFTISDWDHKPMPTHQYDGDNGGH